jgi:beta-glucosidase
VTFHHFTTPRWVAHLGGWEEPDTAGRFARYVERTTAALGDLMGWACTFNEPNVVATMGYLAGVFPPGRRDPLLRRAVNDVIVDAHHRAVEAVRSGPGDAPVGLTLAMTDWQPVDGGEERVNRIRKNYEDVYLEAARQDDFIGVQTYSRSRVNPDGVMPPEDGVELTQMNYEFWPEALEATIRRAWDMTDGIPIFVTENGIGTADDTRRIEYITRALAGVRRCLDDGIDIRGYTCWSALDNFEWALGYMPTFGLIAVDRDTQVRTPKPSAKWLGAIAQGNALDADTI